MLLLCPISDRPSGKNLDGISKPDASDILSPPGGEMYKQISNRGLAGVDGKETKIPSFSGPCNLLRGFPVWLG